MNLVAHLSIHTLAERRVLVNAMISYILIPKMPQTRIRRPTFIPLILTSVRPSRDITSPIPSPMPRPESSCITFSSVPHPTPPFPPVSMSKPRPRIPSAPVQNFSNARYIKSRLTDNSNSFQYLFHQCHQVNAKTVLTKSSNVVTIPANHVIV